MFALFPLLLKLCLCCDAFAPLILCLFLLLLLLRLNTTLHKLFLLAVRINVATKSKKTQQNYLLLPSDLFSIDIAIVLSCLCIAFVFFLSFIHWFFTFLFEFLQRRLNTCRTGMFLILYTFCALIFLFSTFHRLDQTLVIPCSSPKRLLVHTEKEKCIAICLIEFFVKMWILVGHQSKFMRLKWMTHYPNLYTT